MNGYLEVSTQIGRAPSDFTRAQMVRALQRYSGGEAPTAAATSFMSLRKNAWRYLGDITVQYLKVSKVTKNDSDRRREVTVTVCRDQTRLRIVDSAGDVVAEQQGSIPPFLLRQYLVLKPYDAKAWKVFGLQTVKGECR